MGKDTKHKTFLMKALTVLGLAGTAAMLMIFQNCGGYGAATNPLTDSPISTPCLGVSCTRDITTAQFSAGASAIQIDNRSATASTATCDSSTCFDVGGFCESGGFPGTQFTYQWILADGTNAPEQVTAVSCDTTGRFRILVKVPLTTYDYSKVNVVHVYMKVYDENGLVTTNNGIASDSAFNVTTRVQ